MLLHEWKTRPLSWLFLLFSWDSPSKRPFFSFQLRESWYIYVHIYLNKSIFYYIYIFIYVKNLPKINDEQLRFCWLSIYFNNCQLFAVTSHPSIHNESLVRAAFHCPSPARPHKALSGATFSNCGHIEVVEYTSQKRDERIPQRPKKDVYFLK